MIKHIVMWKLKDTAEGKTKKENAEIIKERLESLKGKVEELKGLQMGININSSDAAYDLSLYSEFECQEDLDKYQVNPLHLEIVKYVKKVVQDRKVVDYIV